MPIHISVTDPTTDKLTSVQIDPEDQVENLKALVEVEFGIPFAQQMLKFNDNVLQDHNKISSYNIQDHDIVMVLRKAKKPKNPLMIEAQKILRYYEQNPQNLQQLRGQNPNLASAVERKDAQAIMGIIQQEQQRKFKEQQEFAKKLSDLENDPFNPESQKMIEELINKKNIQENMDYAQEYNPENFGSVTMLYIEIEVNKHPVQAFVDSGAQSTIMSKACAERCGIMRLVDTRFHGMAMGVGTQKIIGKVHAVEIQIMDKFLPCSLTILDGDSIDFLLGLDMLKRFQCLINLEKNELNFLTAQISVPFLPEHKIMKRISLTDEANLLERQNKEDQLKQTGQTTNQQQQPQQTQPQQQQTQQPITQPQPPQQQQQQAQQPVNKDGFPESSIQPLINMGFRRDEAIQALRQCKGNVEMAAALLTNQKYGF